MELNIFYAFLAGFVSFLSPCIFPIIPSYIAYIGAASYEDGFKRKRGALPLILAFIAGFTIVFAVMGIAFSTLGFAFKNYTGIIAKVSGVLVILLGLNSIFNFISILDNEKKVEFRTEKKGFISSLLLGMAFGAGWSPCIGPILASILFLAGNSSTLLSGIILLMFFSIGLGLPFLLSGMFISQFREKSQGIKKHMNKIKVFSGVLIIFIGISIFFDKLSNLNVLLSQSAKKFSDWYLVYNTEYNIATGIVLLIFALLLLFKILKRRKSNKKIFVISIFMSILLLLATISSTGIINWGELVGVYLNFQGI